MNYITYFYYVSGELNWGTLNDYQVISKKWLIKDFMSNEIIDYNRIILGHRVNFQKFYETNFLTPEAMEYLKK